MRLKTLFLPLLGLLAMSCDRQKEDVLDYVNDKKDEFLQKIIEIVKWEAEVWTTNLKK